MASRRCSICSINWPSSSTYSHCMLCGEETEIALNAKVNVSDEEIAEAKKQAVIIKKVLPELTEAQQTEWDADWAALCAECVRRGAGWSHADLFEEWDRPGKFAT